ncbi:MAG: Asp-tRNA(Asn)/Glu-tRNA(Gln) amidotransferase subunit GatC, partial [Pseudomonadota bacterium]|nr:Asp-tRNA(Asn)/Glu-tRNA(Gln) amidotransferase subunit GatC [Pseudomonadota bacterium]
MSVDDKTVHRIARLARIAVPEEEIASLGTELSTILGFIEQLSEVNTDDISP